MRKFGFVIVFLILSCVGVFLMLEVQALAQRNDKVYGTNPGNDPRQGTVHIWKDPETGDRITVVRPGKKNPETSVYGQQNMPIIVYPQITPQLPPYPGGHNPPGHPVFPVHPGIPVGPLPQDTQAPPRGGHPSYGPLLNFFEEERRKIFVSSFQKTESLYVLVGIARKASSVASVAVSEVA